MNISKLATLIMFSSLFLTPVEPLFAVVKSASTKKITVPVVTGKPIDLRKKDDIDFNPILGIEVKTDSTEANANALTVSFAGTTALDDIIEASLFIASGTNPIPQNAGEKISTIKRSDIRNSGEATFNFPDMPLGNKDLLLWLSVTVKRNINLDHIIAAEGKLIKGGTARVPISGGILKQRIAFAVTSPEQMIYDTKLRSSFFRIPGITKTKNGTLIACFDNRYTSISDLPGNIDVGFSSSANGGKTWSPIRTAIHRNDLNKSSPGIGLGVGDPAILTDEKTGTVWISAVASPQLGHPIWASRTNTADPKKTAQWILVKSDDNGKTWSKPINATESIKRLADEDTKNWAAIFQGPGNGICMQDGTLVFPAQVWQKINSKNIANGLIVYSKDNGKTWTSSKIAATGASEAQVVELSDNSLMLNMRNELRTGRRQIATTTDLGNTWQKHSSDSAQAGLTEPTCQAGFTAVKNVLGKENVLFFSNPNHEKSREQMTVRYSANDGKTWSAGLCYDQRQCSGYSALIDIDQNHLGILYEGSMGSIYFMRIPYSEMK